MNDTANNQESTAAVPCTLSIIVPTFNSRSSIARCLQSIAQQGFTDYEVVMQDNSSDDTIVIVQSFQEQRPDVVIRWCSEPDSGVYDAMNKAVRRCNGEWVLFLGSDDAFADEHVLSSMLATAPPSNVGVLYGDVRIVGDTPWAENGTIYDGSFDLQKILAKNICHQAMFYRASLLKDVGSFNPAYRVCSDWDLNLRCWSKMDFLYRAVTVANFYAGGASSTPVFDPAFQKDFFSNIRRYGLFGRLPFNTRLAYLKTWASSIARQAIRPSRVAVDKGV